MKRGSKGHKLISSIQMREILPPTISKSRGLFSPCVGASILTGCAEVLACISSLARSMQQLSNGSNKWQGRSAYIGPARSAYRG